MEFSHRYQLSSLTLAPSQNGSHRIHGHPDAWPCSSRIGTCRPWEPAAIAATAMAAMICMLCRVSPKKKVSFPEKNDELLSFMQVSAYLPMCRSTYSHMQVCMSDVHELNVHTGLDSTDVDHTGGS